MKEKIINYAPYGVILKVISDSIGDIDKGFINYRTGHELLLTSDNAYLFTFLNNVVEPINLLPISSLYKTIIHDNKEVVPIIEIAKIGGLDFENKVLTDSELSFNLNFNGVSDEVIHFRYCEKTSSFICHKQCRDRYIAYPLNNGLEMYLKLLEYRIDVFNIMS